MTSDIRFDFEGSLALARQLWTLADTISDLSNSRRDMAANAAREWKGPLGKEFRERIVDDRNDLLRDAQQLRLGAMAWAEAYAKSVDEQNTRSYTREHARVAKLREDRSVLKDVVAAIGFDDLPLPKAQPKCPVPKSPNFAATGSVKKY